MTGERPHLRVQCPTCKAKAGEPCIRDRWNFASTTMSPQTGHPKRFTRAMSEAALQLVAALDEDKEEVAS